MRILERFRMKVAFHQQQAAHWQQIVAVLEDELGPDVAQKAHRKINGAVREHLQTRRSVAPAVRDRILANRRAAKLTLAEALPAALADGPLTLDDLTARVAELRGVPAPKHTIGVTSAKLKATGALIGGPKGAGVVGLKGQAAQVAKLAKDRSAAGTSKEKKTKKGGR